VRRCDGQLLTPVRWEILTDVSTFPRAVVVGCGIAGIGAAAALRGVVEEVVIVERDQLPREPGPRHGVPQGGQLHNLLSCAQVHLERLLPGFCQALLEAGAGSASVADETHVFELGVRMPQRRFGLRLICAPRPLIEHVARSRLLAGGGVRFLEGARAVGLEADGTGAVAGVAVEQAGSSRTLETPIVVDAAGSRSPGADWLQALGRAPPETLTSRTDQWYVSALFERPAEWIGRDFSWLVFPTPPRSRAGLVSPVGDTEWYVSLSGRARDRPPSTAPEMQEYAGTLEDPVIGELLDRARPLGSPALFRKITATWRRYDLLADPMPGYLPIGDAVASLNPLFGQGMSVAAWESTILGSVLRRRSFSSRDIDEMTREYHAQAAAACRAAWDLGEIIQPDQLQPRESLAELARAVRDDPELHRVYVGVWHLVEPAAKLERLRVASRGCTTAGDRG
jgi:2-polyprenyl-6-methoxyphenol hydroxylase-like FAD-dependent oxidoreductase